MRNKTLVVALATALLGSGTTFAQTTHDPGTEKGPGVDPQGPSSSVPLGAALPGFLCSNEGGSNCSGPLLDDGVSVTSTFDIEGCGDILDVDVGVDITHTWVGDLVVTVAAPGQGPVTLIDRPGGTDGGVGCSGNDIFAVLDDQALTPVENECGGGTPTIDGTFSPNEPLSAFNGVSADGTWTLVATDVEPAGSDEGTLNDWSVDVYTASCGSPDEEVCVPEYDLDPAAYDLRDISASGTSVPLFDDQVSNAIPIGFSFDFYGQTYTEVYISSNGFITFDNSSDSGCCSGDPIPTPGSPNNFVAGFWEDLNPNNGGTIRYQTLGSGGNQELVIGFYNIQHFGGGNAVTMEMILHEGSNRVELQYQSAPSDGGTHTTGIESFGGVFGTEIDHGSYSYSNEAFLLTPQGCQEQTSRATFSVEKYFNDGNPAEVEVTLSCNTGLPLQQSDVISEGDGVNFVVVDFNDGELDCEVTETDGPDGYDQAYNFDFQVSSDACTFNDVEVGLPNFCAIDNDLLPVDVTVTKEWIDDNPEYNAIDYAEANYGCSGAQFGNPYGSLDFFGNPGSDGFSVYPHWNGDTTCWVAESFVDSGIETDDSDCASVSVTLGNDAECTIVNTRLYEGIPTLSQYGLALLAMLMLGLGFVAYRRFV